MDFEFDKEMDALLRQAARGETASANPKSEIRNPKSHLDADEIALFVENALPEKAKRRFIEHFAACDRCRKVLSNVVSLNAETIKKTVEASETAKISSVVPWYRRLFAVPNLAYAMGALLMVFGGIIAYTVLQSANNSKNVEISSQVESTEKMRGPNAGDESRIIESNSASMSNGGSAMSNSSMSMQSNSSPSNAGSAMSNSPASTSLPVISPNGGSMSNGASVSDSATTVNKQTDKRNETAKNEAQNSADSTTAKNDKAASEASGAVFAEQKKQPANAEKMRAADDEKTMKSDAPKPESPTATRSAPAALSVNGRNANDLKNTRAKKSAAETRQTGGKTFRRENGVWYDASYGGQSTTNVSRGSEDFKKLDSGLRSIAGDLSGAIVVVYKGKAYRIQ